jgi:hypothetical protein
MRSFLAVALLLSAAAAQDEDPIDLTLDGVVVGARGEALAGVRVEAWDALDPARFLGEGASGADGRFLLVLRRSDLARREHAFGPLRVCALGAGLATAVAEAPAGARDVRLVAAPARDVRGIVVDADGAPVPGAIVRGSAGGVVEQTTALEDGSFVLRRFAAAPELEAFRDHVGLSARAKGGDAPPTLVLPRAVLVPGRVLALGSGEAVAGARVFWRDRVVAEADATGAFAVPVDPLSPPLSVSVVAPGYVVEPEQAGSGDTLDVRLAKAEPMRGRVADALGRGVGGAVVKLAGDVTFVANTDEGGVFVHDAVPRGLVRLAARAPGFLETAVRLDAGAAGDEVTLSLSRGAAVAGRAVREGAPVTGARVSALDAGGAEVAFGYTDAQGRFLFGGVPLAAARLVAADASGASLGVPLGAIEEGGRGGPYLLEVKDHLPLAGTLRSDAGSPLADVRVRCGGREATTDGLGRFSFDRLPARAQRIEATPDRHFPVVADVRPGSPVDLVATSRFGEAKLEVEVTGAALFAVELAARADPPVTRQASASPAVFEGLAPGSYVVRVVAPGCLEFSQVVGVPAGGAKLAVVLARGGTLTLVASPGASVAIFAVRGKAPPVVALKLAEGTQTLSDFGPGLYRFVSRAEGEMVVVKEIELGPTTPPKDLDLRGGKESTLVVAVRDATGAPVPGAEITLATESGFSRKVGGKTDANGQLKIDRLFDGRNYIRASLGDRLGEASLDVEPGAALSATVTMR